jgi:hypothetical protein
MLLDNLLNELGLKGFSTALKRQMDDPKYLDVSFEDRLVQLLQSEHIERMNRKMSIVTKIDPLFS